MCSVPLCDLDVGGRTGCPVGPEVELLYSIGLVAITRVEQGLAFWQLDRLVVQEYWGIAPAYHVIPDDLEFDLLLLQLARLLVGGLVELVDGPLLNHLGQVEQLGLVFTTAFCGSDRRHRRHCCHFCAPGSLIYDRRPTRQSVDERLRSTRPMAVRTDMTSVAYYLLNDSSHYNWLDVAVLRRKVDS